MMNSGIKGLLIFTVGVCTGAAGAYFYFKEKFNKELDKEVEKVKHYNDSMDIYSGKNVESEVPEETAEQTREVAAPEKPSLFDYAKLSSQKHKNAKPEVVEQDTGFHLVSPERFEELSYEYETQDLIAYSDGVVTDTQDNIMYHDLDKFVTGATFEDFDKDGYLYVADDAISRLYEVSLDNRTYADVFDTED